MALTNWKNLPDTTTPVNASNLNSNFGQLLPLSGGTMTGNIVLSNGTYLRGIDQNNNTINLIRAYNNMNCIGDSAKETRIWSSATPTISVGGSVKTLATVDDIYYKNNDTYSIDGSIHNFIGQVTGSAKIIRFSIPLPKRLDNITSVTINTLTFSMRVPSGNYSPAANTNFLTDSNTSKVEYSLKDNLLTISVTGTNAWTNAVNNIPVNISPTNISITFKS